MPWARRCKVQEETGNRLTTWFDSLTSLGCHCQTSKHRKPIGPRLEGVDVYVTLTRQRAGNEFRRHMDFSDTPADLYALQQWAGAGHSILMFTNHSGFPDSAPPNQEPALPIFEIQLAAALGIQLVFASFAPTGSSPVVSNPCQGGHSQTLSMTPARCAPPALVQGVCTVQALDSGGIVTAGGTPIIDLPCPCDCVDRSPLGYSPDPCSFAALYRAGAGKVIVMGHSGITANNGTCFPSAGQIGAADNLAFLNNCITFPGS